MKKQREWILLSEYIFNVNTLQLIHMPGIKAKDFTKKFLASAIFEKMIADSPSIQQTSIKPHKIMALEITNKCNYACPYCFEGKSYDNNAKMSVDCATQYLDLLPADSEIRFFGGEPLLHFDFIQTIVKKYPQHRYSLVTNGSLITPTVIELLIEHFFNVGLSYDGEKWQTKNRPKPNGDSLIDFQNAIELFTQFNFPIGISTVVTQESLANLYEIHLEVFGKYDIVNAWAYLLAYNDKMGLKDLDIFQEQIFQIIDDFPAIHLMRINDLKKWAMKVSGQWPLDGFCGAGNCYSAVAVDGTERLCTFFLRENTCYVPALATMEVDCKKCDIWNFCKGGCLALNKYVSGKTHKSHPFACKKNRIYFEAGLRTRIKLLQDQKTNIIIRSDHVSRTTD